MKIGKYTVPRQRLDKRFLSMKPESRYHPPPKGWIRAIRDALGMSGAQLGRRIGVKAQSVADIERSEASGSIQLKTFGGQPRRWTASLSMPSYRSPRCTTWSGGEHSRLRTGNSFESLTRWISKPKASLRKNERNTWKSTFATTFESAICGRRRERPVQRTGERNSPRAG